MQSLVSAEMKSSKGLITRILRAKACRSCTTYCPCPSTTRFSSTVQSAAAAYEISSGLPSPVERHAGASRRIPQHVIGKGNESVHGESLPWGSLCLAAAGVVAVAQSLDSTRGNQVNIAKTQMPQNRHGVPSLPSSLSLCLFHTTLESNDPSVESIALLVGTGFGGLPLAYAVHT